MQRAIPALWRFHCVHHSIRELNSVMSFHHPIEGVLRSFAITLPLALLVRFDDVPVIPIVSAFVGAWGQFIHTDTRVSLGLGRILLSDNHYHRIHRSERQEHYDKNFASFFPFWDWLFGTMHMPVSGEYPSVGVPERPQGILMRDLILGIA
jgi:sterol desaturase/sphingolipid hydroxylase (fatty acid hydroxylase superfamily)